MKTDLKQWTVEIINASRYAFATFLENIPAKERKMKWPI
jgi:hypothetical protein